VSFPGLYKGTGPNLP